MNKLDLTNSGMAIMFLATSLCERYDEWKDDLNMTTVADLNTNSICLGLKEMYPMITDRVRQSMALAFSMYFYLLVSGGLQNTNKQIEEENIMFALNDFSTD